MIFNVSEGNCRLDNYLFSKMDLSRSRIQKMVRDGNVCVNGCVSKCSYLVKVGDVISVTVNDVVSNTLEKDDIKLDIVYEDDDLLIVNKPSGMVVHHGNGNYRGTLANGLVNYSSNLSGVNGEFRPGIVHRIDADTSGLLMVAKNDRVHLMLQDEIKKNKASRKYLALVSGVIKEDTATIDAPIGRDSKDRKKMAVTSINSKNAITHIRVLERYSNATYIECTLETGRTHQIRVHLSYINHPIINDRVYNPKSVVDREFGQMLHAYSLGFVHPTKGEYMEFKVDPPKRFYEILDMYKD